MISPEELAEWDRRTALEPVKMADPLWRLTNLYQCLTEDGQAVHFVPTPEQRTVMVAIYIRGWLRIIIPKARQLGISLLLNLIGLDGVVFQDGFSGAWVDKTQPDAEKKKREKFKFAWERLPASIRRELKVETDTNAAFIVRGPKAPGATDDPPASTFEFGINFRGGTVEFLVVSEWGTVQNDDRQRSREIKAGAIPAVERAANGLCVVETTWKGGLDGEVGPYVLEALDVPEAQKGPKSWRILFFGWQTCPSYRQSHGYIDPESEKYFAEVEAKGVVLDHEQKLWYAEKRRTATSAKTIKEEYPTLPHECWENMPQGSFYGYAIEAARTAGRIRLFETDRWPVHTFWDLGLPINTVTWYAQIRPEAILLVDVDLELDIDMTTRAERMRAKGWPYGFHFLPWDAGQKSTLSVPPVAEYAKHLGPNVRVVPQIGRVVDGINLVHKDFPRFVFHSERCKRALEFLSRYRSERETSTGIAKDVPVHDRYSHVADALRQVSQALAAGMIEGGNTVGAAAESEPKIIRAVMGLSSSRPRAIMP